MGMHGHFHITLLGPYLTDVLFVQSFNSLGQNACTVAAYMMSTCHGGCKLFTYLFCLALALAANLIVSYLFQRSQSKRCHRDTTTLADIVLRPLTCACAAPSNIHSEVHVTDARDQIGLGTIHVVFLFSNARAYVSAIRWTKYAYNCTKTVPPCS
jgi:hypothetical protein